MADFNFYALNYKGSAIPDENAFESAVVEAQAYVDALITDRTNLRYDFVTEAYNKAICAAADEIYKANTIDEGGVLLSESVGNHSKSYKDTAKSSQERNKSKYDKVRMYLANTGLLYRGIG